jgi:hypothetical protein
MNHFSDRRKGERSLDLRPNAVRTYDPPFHPTDKKPFGQNDYFV